MSSQDMRDAALVDLTAAGSAVRAAEHLATVHALGIGTREAMYPPDFETVLSLVAQYDPVAILVALTDF